MQEDVKRNGLPSNTHAVFNLAGETPFNPLRRLVLFPILCRGKFTICLVPCKLRILRYYFFADGMMNLYLKFTKVVLAQLKY